MKDFTNMLKVLFVLAITMAVVTVADAQTFLPAQAKLKVIEHMPSDAQSIVASVTGNASSHVSVTSSSSSGSSASSSVSVSQSISVESDADPDVIRSTPIDWGAPKKVQVPSKRAAPLAPASLAVPVSGPNLIANPSVETSDAAGIPNGWAKGGYGVNSRTYVYPVAGHNGGKALEVIVSNFQSGDAKWYFDDVPVTPGKTYQFSDYSHADVPSTIDVRYTMKDGSFVYKDIAFVPKSASWQRTSVSLTIPSNVVSITMFHYIEENGTLVTDDFALVELSGPAPLPGMLPLNGDLETLGANGDPILWHRGVWGANTAVFTYPVTGAGGGKAAKVTITSFQSGDAKWYFEPVHLDPGTYTYADQYQSNIKSEVDVEFHHANGTYTYADIGEFAPAAAFTSSGPLSFTVPSDVTDLTVFRLIEGVGEVTIDDVRIANSGVTPPPPPPPPSANSGMVTFTFDDGWLSQYQNAAPTLKSAGMKATYYIVTRQLSDYGFSGFMSTANIKSLYASGNDIEAHTQHHPHLTELPPGQAKQEIEGARTDLFAMGISPVDSFDYPYGEYDASTVKMVAAAGYTSAVSTIDDFADASSDVYQLPRKEIRADTTLATAESWVNEAMQNKTWLIIEMHKVDNSGDTYSISPSNFSALVKYIAARPVKVVTVPQGLSALEK